MLGKRYGIIHHYSSLLNSKSMNILLLFHCDCAVDMGLPSAANLLLGGYFLRNYVVCLILPNLPSVTDNSPPSRIVAKSVAPPSILEKARRQGMQSGFVFAKKKHLPQHRHRAHKPRCAAPEFVDIGAVREFAGVHTERCLPRRYAFP